MILAYDTLEDLYLKCLARLSDQFSCLETNISFKNQIPILGNKYKVVLNIENRVTAISILHRRTSTLRCLQRIIIAKADRLKPVGNYSAPFI